MRIHFKEDFLLGVASAATQIEGGEWNHTWNDWYHKGKIRDGSNPARANQHYDLFLQDIQLMKKMKIQTYRFGVEWARIQPEEGIFVEEVLAHYRLLIQALIEAGIKPLLTLHHFTNPLWFEEKGGFTKKENITFFLEFVKRMVLEVGDLVDEYITMNEPNVYATEGFFFGHWPPGITSGRITILVMSIMAAAHIEAYELIHKLRKQEQYPGWEKTRVSFANHLRVFEPKSKWNIKHQINCKIAERLFQDSLSDAMGRGIFIFPFKNICRLPKGEYCDFIGINYYSKTTVTGLGDGVQDQVPINDLGWEIYPKGIVECARVQYKKLQRPIYITENGTCDSTDRFRSRFIYEHLKEMMASDLPFERYYHWCFTDNFEWLEGESARFGLVHVNYETQERTMKESGSFFSKMIEAKGVTRWMYETEVEHIEYDYNKKIAKSGRKK